MLTIDKPSFLHDEALQIFEDATGKFFDEFAPPERIEKWRREGQVEVAFWRQAGAHGLLGLSVPEEYGGGGADFRFEVVLNDLVLKKGAVGFMVALHNGIIIPYIMAHGTEEQKGRWLPKLCTGELIGAVAMSEPGAGSDLQSIRTSARRDGNGYRLNGQKTFISSGQIGNFIIVVAKTDPGKGAGGISLVVLETDGADGFQRGRKLDKVGQDAADTSELFFDEVWVPAENILGMEEGRGFSQLMTELPRERLLVALEGATNCEIALDLTAEYVKSRKAFGKAVFDYQNTQFKLAEIKTETTIARVFVNYCLELQLAGKLDGVTAAMAKYWVSDLENKIVDQCLQLHGGYGYMNEYGIGRMFRDCRVSRIYGGTNEIMKLIIARAI
jgi:acyl-CoA dehydrogenase